MVFPKDTAAVKFLLKERGLLKSKGKAMKPKSKIEISMKNVTNVSSFSNSMLEEDEFTIVIPTKVVNNRPSVAKPTLKNHITPSKPKPITKTPESTTKEMSRNFKTTTKHETTKGGSQLVRSVTKPVISKNSVNSQEKSDDDDDEFTIKIPNILNNNTPSVSVKHLTTPTLKNHITPKSIYKAPESVPKEQYQDLKTIPKLEPYKRGSQSVPSKMKPSTISENIVRYQEESDEDDDEFTIKIPFNQSSSICNKSEKSLGDSFSNYPHKDDTHCNSSFLRWNDCMTRSSDISNDSHSIDLSEDSSVSHECEEDDDVEDDDDEFTITIPNYAWENRGKLVA